jgi:poly(3-hydroxybutyrate) depolymerase
MKGTAKARPSHRRSDRLYFTRTIVFQGSADQTVNASNAQAILAEASPGSLTGITQRREDFVAGGRACRRAILSDGSGRAAVEYWLVEGAGHAWMGGDTRGSFTDADGPNASTEMVRFFLET